MSYQHIIYEIKGPVSWITLNRPGFLNALSTEVALEAIDALTRSLSDDKSRVVVFTGKGKAFSAGADVIEIADDPNPQKRIELLVTIAHRAIAEIKQAKKPTIAAINHQAAGYGMALALACDIRIATENVRLRYAYSTIGLTGDGAINYTLPRMVGISRALEVALLREDIHADEAKKYGIINKFFPEETFLDDTQKIAEQIAMIPPDAASAIKRMMYSSENADLLSHLATEHAYLTEAAGTPEFIDLIKKISLHFKEQNKKKK
jgi:2-(1,2-epoxy-1,2-dihydrophenyl)acetyl-CoA isomerase